MSPSGSNVLHMNKLFLGVMMVLTLTGAGCVSQYVVSNAPPEAVNGTAVNAPAVPPPTTTGAAPADNAARVYVSIQNFAFNPATTTIKAGTAVTWVNNDGVEHQIGPDQASRNAGLNGPASPVLAQGDTYSFTFDTPGTYSYQCMIHPSMTGKVIVTR